MESDTTLRRESRLDRLLRFLEKDPNNPALLADAADAAFSQHAFGTAEDLLARRERVAVASPALKNLSGLVALAQKHFPKAIDIFEELRRQYTDDPAIRFNLAWAKAMTGAYSGALELLDDDVLKSSSRAPALKVEMMHHLGLYSDAVAASKDLAATYPGNEALMGALATLMLDAERPDLAEEFARKARNDSDGQAALGMLALGTHEPQRSLALFDRALTTEPENPRAWIGKGLSLLAEGNAKAAAQAIDRGAEIFGDHLGSWVASGWAHFVARDYKAARQSFERAVIADPSFSEGHGGLAVLDILDNRFEEADRRVEIALRLDKKCFGAALAKSLLLERGGHAQIAKKVLDMAMSTPIGLNGETIAEAALGFSRARQRPRRS